MAAKIYQKLTVPNFFFFFLHDYLGSWPGGGGVVVCEGQHAFKFKLRAGSKLPDIHVSVIT